MKKIWLFLILIFCFASVANAADFWCRWDKTKSEGYGCVSDGRGYIKIYTGLKVGGGEDNYNLYGYHKLTQTEPIIPTDHKKGDKIWGNADNEITLTWTVVEMTEEEINAREAMVLDLQLYHVLKWLVNTPGSIDVTTGQLDPSTAPAALRKAYLARQALGQ